MKVRVKATGEILEVYESCVEDFHWTDEMGDKVWKTEELIFLETTDNTPDYWIRLEHQYAGMAMQGLSEKYFKEYRDYCAGFGDMDEDEAKGAMEDFANAMADVCYYFAHALVQKLKEKEERK